MHWSAKYIGQPYAQADCAELAVQVRAAEFDHRLVLPTERDPNPFTLSALIGHHQGDYAERTASPHEGDAVLMRARGRLNHVGIYCDIHGQPHVLHALKHTGQTCLHRLHELPAMNLEIEGFYKWL